MRPHTRAHESRSMSHDRPSPRMPCRVGTSHSGTGPRASQKLAIRSPRSYIPKSTYTTTNTHTRSDPTNRKTHMQAIRVKCAVAAYGAAGALEILDGGNAARHHKQVDAKQRAHGDHHHRREQEAKPEKCAQLPTDRWSEMGQCMPSKGGRNR